MNSGGTSENSTPCQRLEGWKEISAFFRRSERTVIRWESRGLPVHRTATGTVVAYTNELEQWYANGASATRNRNVSAQRQQWYMVWIAVAGIAGCVILAWRLAHRSQGEGIRSALVWQGPSLERMGDISPDGTLVCYTDPPSETLQIRRLPDGEPWPVTTKAPYSQVGAAWHCAFSKDGGRVAYTRDMGEWLELRTATIRGAEDRLLMRRTSSCLIPADWSPDGKMLAVLVCDSGPARRLALVHVEDGSIRSEHAAASRHGVARFSSEGRWVAFDAPAPAEQQQPGQRSVIALIDTASGSQATVTAPPGESGALAGWAPDGGILYWSERSGSMDLRHAALRNGAPAGQEIVLARNLGPLKSMRVTRNGSVYYAVRVAQREVRVAELDVAGGRLIQADVPLPGRPKQTCESPAWSPDGAQLGLLSHRVVSDVEEPLVFVLPTDTGSRIEHRPALANIFSLHWAPGGESLVVSGMDAASPSGIFRVNLNSGAVTPIRRSGDLGRFLIQAQEPAPGGVIYYKVRERQREPAPLFRYRADRQSDEPVLPSVYSYALSRDGKLLVFSSFDANEEYVRLLDTASGQVRELHREKRQGRILSVALTADSRWVLYAQRGQLWRVPLAGGAPVAMPLQAANLRDLRPHPDGKRLAYTAGETERSELWVISGAAVK